MAAITSMMISVRKRRNRAASSSSAPTTTMVFVVRLHKGELLDSVGSGMTGDSGELP